uniref:Chromo domain-containing protein n=1 Tax=Ditylenchus dipsaci TaxID=166011 RepID=A0A915DBH8_9BILA
MVVPPVSIDEVLGPKYVVEAVVGKRTLSGRVEYLVKWEGFDAAENTWEPELHFKDSKNLIKEFENKRKKTRVAVAKKVKKEIIAEEYQRFIPDPQLAAVQTVSRNLPAFEEPHPDNIYEVQKGKKVSKILGVRHGRKIDGLVALVLYEDGVSELVPTKILGANSFNEILAFYEERIVLKTIGLVEMRLFLFFVLFHYFVLGLAQNSSSTEIIANGRENCPAVNSSDYDIIPFYANQGDSVYSNITSISIVPASGGPAIANFPIRNMHFCLFSQDQSTLAINIVELLNGTYTGTELNNPTVPCHTDYERPNIVMKFQVSDGRQGEWVITPEHWSGLWPAEGNTCRFFMTAWPQLNAWYSDDFHARHYCIARNTGEKTYGLAGASINHQIVSSAPLNTNQPPTTTSANGLGQILRNLG